MEETMLKSILQYLSCHYSRKQKTIDWVILQLSSEQKAKIHYKIGNSSTFRKIMRQPCRINSTWKVNYIWQTFFCHLKSVDKGEWIDVMNLDFKKAFDEMPHIWYCHHLRVHKVVENILVWLREWHWWVTNGKYKVINMCLDWQSLTWKFCKDQC